MIVLSTFLESSLNFLFNNLKKHYKIWYSQGEKQCQILNCQKHSLKEQSATKSPEKATYSKKMIVLSTFFESSLNFLFKNLKKHYKIRYSQGEKRCQILNCQKHSLKEQSQTKLPVKPTWSKKMIVLSTFSEFPLNFLSDNLKKHYKIWYSQGEKRCQILNCQKHSLKEQSATKSPVKPTCSTKMIILSKFSEFSWNFLSDNLKKHYKIWYSQGEKRCQILNCQQHSLKEQSRIKSPEKPSCSKKIIVLSTFLESSLNFLFNNLKKYYKIWYS